MTVSSPTAIFNQLKQGLLPSEAATAGWLTVLRSNHSAAWETMAKFGHPDQWDWAVDHQVPLPVDQASTWLLHTLLRGNSEDAMERASWWIRHGAQLPPDPPAAPAPIRSSEFTLDSLWRHLVDQRRLDAITWLAAQGAPVRFQREELGLLVVHAIDKHASRGLDVIERLVDAGADLSQVDAEGDNVLHALARISVPDAAQVAPFRAQWQLLLEGGADPLQANRAGETPVSLVDPLHADFVQACRRQVQADHLDAPSRRAARQRRT